MSEPNAAPAALLVSLGGVVLSSDAGPAAIGPIDVASGRHRVDVVRNVRIPTAEPGVSLSLDLFLPVDAGPVPALITVLPYRKDATWGICDTALYTWYAERGLACLMVDLRGTGSSDGRQRPPFDPAEAYDAIAAIDWAAAQSWCNGNVGMWGHSYGALISLRTACLRPSNLKAILPLMGMLDPESDFVHPGGAAGNIESLAAWGVQTLVNQILPPLHDFGDTHAQLRWAERLYDTEPWLVGLLEHPPGDPFWRERVIDVSRIDVPAFCVAGWRDMFSDGTIRTYEQIAAPKKLLVGPWTHVMPQVAAFQPVDFPRLSLRWWEYWLCGSDNGIMSEPAVTAYLQGDRPQWCHLSTWPPASTTTAHWATGDSTTLRYGPTDKHTPNGGSSSGVIASGALDPTAGALSTGALGFGADDGLPIDQHDDDVRGLTCSTETLADELTLAGRAAVTVRTRPDIDPRRLVVRLSDVDPAGRSRLITAGVAEPAKPGRASVTLCPTYYRVAAGHRLRVVVTDADFPRLWPVCGSPSRDGLALIGVNLDIPTFDVSTRTDLTVAMAPPSMDWNAATAILSTRPTYSTTRDHLHGRITVLRGDEVLAVTPEHRHVLKIRSNMEATVTRASPVSARTRSTTTAHVRLASGETIEAIAELRLTTGMATATANLTIDGAPFFSRRWEIRSNRLDTVVGR